MADLQTDKRKDIARQIHVLAATLEQEAVSRGCVRAYGIAAGSCKELFCADLAACPVLDRNQPCLHANLARPSLSALGINFELMAKTAGWPSSRPEDRKTPPEEPAMAMMAGLVLLA